MKVLIVSLLCLRSAVANSLHMGQISTKEVEVKIIETNLVADAAVQAAEVLEADLKHYDDSVDVAESFAETFQYPNVNCIWSVAVDPALVYHNGGNGRTGFVTMLGKKTGLTDRYFHVYSSPKNGKICTIPTM